MKPHIFSKVCKFIGLFLLTIALFSSCEKGYTEEDVITPTDGDKVRVSFNVAGYDVVSFGNMAQKPSLQRKSENLGSVCSRLSFALFDENGTKLTYKNQKQSDSNFGTFSLSVGKGAYKLVVVAHSSEEGNATISSPGKITFEKNKVTDTFYYYGSFTIEEDENFDIVLQRAVAMFRLKITDTTPADVTRMKFYYTGGSSTFDATSGYGCVNSKQAELRDVPSSAYNQSSVYEVYTFPHSDGKNLKIKAYALTAVGDTLQECEFTDVPVERNKITECTTTFFGDPPSGGRTIHFTVNSEWNGTITYNN